MVKDVRGVLGIGVDIVAVARFEPWLDYSQERLLRVFTLQELHDRVESYDKRHQQVQKLAACFAAKEAFYKAFSSCLLTLHLTNIDEFSFLSSCPYIEVTTTTFGVPGFTIDWSFFEKKTRKKLPSMNVHLSLSDEQAMVVAFVVIVQE